jgi:hypothetical protein
MTDQVSEGADAQIRSLDSALSGLNEMSASLKETATQAGIGGRLDREPGVVDLGGRRLVEQVTRNSRCSPTFVRQTVTAIQQSNDSIQRTTSSARKWRRWRRRSPTSMTEVTASVRSDHQRHAEPDVVGQRNRRAQIEEMTRVGAGRGNQCRRHGRGGRGNRIRDQRVRRVDRGSDGDGGQSDLDHRADGAVHPSSWPDRYRASRAAGNRSATRGRRRNERRSA